MEFSSPAAFIRPFFFFFLAKIEGGEYESAFKAYGVSVALTCLFFIKGNVQ